jgi:hypothetical protein
VNYDLVMRRPEQNIVLEIDFVGHKIVGMTNRGSQFLAMTETQCNIKYP